MPSGKYDLEDRTLRFARDVRSFVRRLPKDAFSLEDAKQLARSAGSVGANYIEANDALSKKDFCMRIKISRKEAKESRFWLNCLEIEASALIEERNRLIDESGQLAAIFGAILKKTDIP